MLARTLSRVATRSLNRAPMALRAPMVGVQQRFMAQGPAVGGEISDELLEKLGTLSTQSLVDGLWVMGWPDATIEGARPLGKGQKAVGRAVTLNFVPARPDIAADKPLGVASPEYEAFELCGPKNILVMASVGPWESVGGDIKFLRLKQLSIGGLVTDGSVGNTAANKTRRQIWLQPRTECIVHAWASAPPHQRCPARFQLPAIHLSLAGARHRRDPLVWLPDVVVLHDRQAGPCRHAAVGVQRRDQLR